MKVILTSNALDIVKEFDEASEEVKSQMKFAMFRALSILKAQVQQNLRDGSSVNVQTGNLLNSITYEIIDKGLVVEGRLGPENVPYAAIHEFGGTLPARFVKPRLRKALKFQKGGEDIFSSGHMIPPVKIPPRPYLQPAVAKHINTIAEKFAVFTENAIDLNRE